VELHIFSFIYLGGVDTGNFTPYFDRTRDKLPHYIRGGPKNNRNLNVARELEVVARCAARCLKSTQCSSSLPHGVNLGLLLLLLWLFF